MINKAIGKYSMGQTPLFENFSCFEDTKSGRTIATLLPLGHRIDFAVIRQINHKSLLGLA